MKESRAERFRNAEAGGSLSFRIPYGGRADFDWWLDGAGHDVLVECIYPWKGLHTDTHRIGMGPRFSLAEARRLAEELARRIVGNLEDVIGNRNDPAFEFISYYDNRQLPLYRAWAWEERKRRYLEVGLLAEALRDDDADDDSAEDGAMSAAYEERAERELRDTPVEVVGEVGPLSRDELKEKGWVA